MSLGTMLRLSCISFIAIIFIVKNVTSLDAVSDSEFIAVTVATNENDALTRYKQSAEAFKIPYEIYGIGQTWEGGDLANKPGGGQKINIIKESLKKYSENDDLIIMFTDSYDVVFQNNTEAIVKKFKETGAKILFSAEGFCWPDRSLKESYPMVGDDEKRYLNSGGFIGYASYLYKVITHKTVLNEEDDQLYYTEIFLNETLRTEYQMKLDTRSEIFQNLNGVLDEVVILFKDNLGFLKNVISGSIPVVIHANGPIKTEFNSLTNYIGHSWNPTDGCQHCKKNQINFASKMISDYPRVTLALFIVHKTPFMDEYFNHIAQLSYSKSKLDVLIYCLADSHYQQCTNFVNQNKNIYSSIKLIDQREIKSEKLARNNIIDKSTEINNDFLLVVDSIVQLTNKALIQELISQNRSIVAPLVTRRETFWSNFWGALSSDGFYARSDDYMEIVKSSKKGIWNVPFVNSVYMISNNTLKKLKNAYGDVSETEMDMALCKRARKENVFMYVDNRLNYGHQVVATEDQGTIAHLHGDLWEIFNNPLDWEEKYIHNEYFAAVSDEKTMEDIDQPCQDVFWFPIVSKTFCKHMIEEMENFGQWSDGGNKDSRLEGGYENVPTRDIHMRQVEWEPHWLHILKTYIYPMQKKIFAGYDDIPEARMNFVVRYRPDEQPTLRPHHDASSYSLNIALNLPGVDYEGGGTRFQRYNCQVKQSKLGWVLMHPGRVTHLHEGLSTTNGTRYIFVTFVNP